jgi:hypothetical protein
MDRGVSGWAEAPDCKGLANIRTKGQNIDV